MGIKPRNLVLCLAAAVMAAPAAEAIEIVCPSQGQTCRRASAPRPLARILPCLKCKRAAVCPTPVYPPAPNCKPVPVQQTWHNPVQMHRQPAYGPRPGTLVISTANQCATERAIWQAADAELQQSAQERDAAAAQVESDQAAVAAAQAALAAAEASLASSQQTYAEASAKVASDSQTAAGAYKDYLGCVTGTEPEPEPEPPAPPAPPQPEPEPAPPEALRP